jgi:hypothetical protein
MDCLDYLCGEREVPLIGETKDRNKSLTTFNFSFLEEIEK